MSDLRKAVEELMPILDKWKMTYPPCSGADWDKVEALRQALAKPEQEPEAWLIQYSDSHEFVWSKPDGWRVKQALEIQPLYAAPPKREWAGLSVSKAEDLLGEFENDQYEMLFALDKYLREKNE